MVDLLGKQVVVTREGLYRGRPGRIRHIDGVWCEVLMDMAVCWLHQDELEVRWPNGKGA